jgi:hypothetical protein
MNRRRRRHELVEKPANLEYRFQLWRFGHLKVL